MAITLVNHATILLQLKGVNILTDPVWSERASPVSWFGPKRVREPGIAFEKLPKIDFVLISHNHYDHLDLETLKKLELKFKPKFFVPLGNQKLLRDEGIDDVSELDWWQEESLSQDVGTQFVPTQHFSARSPFDSFQSLWGGFVLTFYGHRIYFGGDTAYSVHFKNIRERVGAMDIALLPIGAFEPNWFMKSVHMNPREAVQAHLDLQSGLSLGMHFGTFQMSEEKIDQPVNDLKIAVKNLGVKEGFFDHLIEGRTRIVDLRTTDGI